jgi:hypothetical protein
VGLGPLDQADGVAMLIASIALALVAAVVEHLIGLGDPWKKIVVVGIVILFVLGLIQVLLPGLIPIGGLR